ncbi:TPA: hypothetical protein ACUKI8_001611 [Escherichia coli]
MARDLTHFIINSLLD